MKMNEKTCRSCIFRPSRAANSIVSGWIRSIFKLIQAFMHVLVTYKNEGARVATIFLHFKSLVIIPDAQGQLAPKSQVRAGQI